MRSNRLIFSVIYGVGLLLIAAIFLTFTSKESRTSIAWLNFFIVAVVYSGLWGRYSLLYPMTGRFSGRVPLLSMYWLSFFTYAATAFAAMLIFWAIGVGFEKQLLLQICFFFAFAAVLGIGVGASNFIQDESARTEQQIGGIREIRQKTSQIQVLLTSMPPAYGMVRNAFEGIVEAATYTGGRNNPSAREIETRILESLDKLQMQCAVSAQPEECLATIASAKASLEALKTLQNA